MGKDYPKSLEGEKKENYLKKEREIFIGFDEMTQAIRTRS